MTGISDHGQPVQLTHTIRTAKRRLRSHCRQLQIDFSDYRDERTIGPVLRCKQPTTARTAERYLGRLQIVAVGNEVANAVSLEQREALILGLLI